LPSSVTPIPEYTPPNGVPPPKDCIPCPSQTISSVFIAGTGESKASEPSQVSSELPGSALNPSPLLAKASHKRHSLAPP